MLLGAEHDEGEVDVFLGRLDAGAMFTSRAMTATFQHPGCGFRMKTFSTVSMVSGPPPGVDRHPSSRP